MVLVIAEHKSGNDDFGTMSPALTREHSQDVADSKVDIHKNRLAITTASVINSLSSSLIFPQCRDEGDSIESRNYSNAARVDGCSTDDRSIVKNGVTRVSTNGNTNNGDSDSSFVTESNTEKMTPRILHSSINAAIGLTNAAVTRTLDCAGVQITQQSTTHAASCSSSLPFAASPIGGVPKIVDMVDEHDDLEKKISSTIKRISHLQGILVARYSKRQIKHYVSKQQKLLLDYKSRGPHATLPPVNRTTDSGTACNNVISTAAAGLAASCNVNCTSIPESVGNLLPVEPVSYSSTLTNDPSNKPDIGRIPPNPTLPADSKNRVRLQTSVGTMSSNLRQMQADVDSDVTESSSGEDTDCDITVVDNLPHSGIPYHDL